MRIDSPEKAYRVISVLKKELSVTMYLASEYGSGRDKKEAPQYLLLELLNPVLCRELVLYLTEHGNECDPELADCFVKEGIVWVVFPYHTGGSFQETVKRADSYKERIALWEGLLEQLFLRRMPMYLRYEAAASDNVVVDETASVRVNFALFEIDRRHDRLFPELQKRLYGYFQMLFADHPACADGAADYAGQLAAGAFENEAELYREWHGLRALFLEEKERQQGQGMLLRLWKLLFLHLDGFLKCVYWVVVLALWVLFFLLCLRDESAPEQRARIGMIGTVEVEEQQESGTP